MEAAAQIQEASSRILDTERVKSGEGYRVVQGAKSVHTMSSIGQERWESGDSGFLVSEFNGGDVVRYRIVVVPRDMPSQSVNRTQIERLHSPPAFLYRLFGCMLH